MPLVAPAKQEYVSGEWKQDQQYLLPGEPDRALSANCVPGLFCPDGNANLATTLVLAETSRPSIEGGKDIRRSFSFGDGFHQSGGHNI